MPISKRLHFRALDVSKSKGYSCSIDNDRDIVRENKISIVTRDPILTMPLDHKCYYSLLNPDVLCQYLNHSILGL